MAVGFRVPGGLRSVFLIVLVLVGVSSQARPDFFGLTGRVLLPGDPLWVEGVRGFAAAAPYEDHAPRAIVYAQNNQDIVNALKYCRENGIVCRPRSGGHNYEGFSSLAKDGVIIDLSEMNSIHFSNSNRFMHVQAGAKMHELYEALGWRGRIVPLATGPTVGVAGLVAVGGFGVSSRLHGMAATNVESMNVILTDGREIRVSESEHADLFWALRGGGGNNVGIITDITFRTHHAPLVGVFEIEYGWEMFKEVVDAWQNWSPDAPRGITSAMAMITDQGGKPAKVLVFGQFTPDGENSIWDFKRLIEPMTDARLNPTRTRTPVLPTLLAGRMVLGLNPVTPCCSLKNYRKDQLYKSTASNMGRNLTQEELSELKSILESAPDLHEAPSQASMVQFLPSGGALSELTDDQTPVAFHARSTRFMAQLNGYWTASEDEAPTRAWVERLRSFFHSMGGFGGYAGYSDWAHTMRDYVGEENAGKLLEIERKYDPHNLTQNPQGWSSHSCSDVLL